MLAAAVLAALVPTLVHDSREGHHVTGVRGDRGPVAYSREAGDWVQYWLYFEDNTQDRGIVRTGRHKGDWEVVQVRRDGTRIVMSQHSGSESCPLRGLTPQSARLRGQTPLDVYVARGSHALYLRPGVRDRMWPDPNDEADGRGLRVRPRVIDITTRDWLGDRRPWGDTRAGWVPGEMDSPPGPAFQGVRWDDPDAFARSARACERGRCDEVDECDGREQGIAVGFLALLAGAIGLRIRSRR